MGGLLKKIVKQTMNPMGTPIAPGGGAPVGKFAMPAKQPTPFKSTPPAAAASANPRAQYALDQNAQANNPPNPGQTSAPANTAQAAPAAGAIPKNQTGGGAKQPAVSAAEKAWKNVEKTKGAGDSHLIFPPKTANPAANANPAAPTPDAPTDTTDLGPDVTPGETSVETRMNGLLRHDNEYMQAAEAQGNKEARRRGLGSSSMAVQAAQASRVNAALPIASQDASQSHTQLMQQRDIRSREMLSRLDRDQQIRIAKMNVSASERTAASQLAASFEQTYSDTIAAIMGNPDLPASARKAYTIHAGKVRDSNLKLVEQMYGIKLNWASASRLPPGTPSTDPKKDKDGNIVEEDDTWAKINNPLGIGPGYEGKKKPSTGRAILDPAGWFS